MPVQSLGQEIPCKWQSAPILPGKSHGQRSLAGYSPRGWKRAGHNDEITATRCAKTWVVKKASCKIYWLGYAVCHSGGNLCFNSRQVCFMILPFINSCEQAPWSCLRLHLKFSFHFSPLPPSFSFVTATLKFCFKDWMIMPGICDLSKH